MATEFNEYIAELEPEHSIVLLGNEESVQRISRTLVASALGNTSNHAEDLNEVNELTAALDGPRNAAGQLVLSGAAETLALMAIADRGVDTLCLDLAARAQSGQITVDQYRAAYTNVYDLPTLGVITREGLCAEVDTDCIDPRSYPLEGSHIEQDITPEQLEFAAASGATHYAYQMELVQNEDNGRVELLSRRQHTQIGTMNGENFAPIATLLEGDHPVMMPENPGN
ncbi:MAG TPA: hypothetical protein VLG11_02760 [Candidatus Saccharimonadales bacterium]|nr:hypothetical protein [Candidatus Saccharimonadales bacterium]